MIQAKNNHKACESEKIIFTYCRYLMDNVVSLQQTEKTMKNYLISEAIGDKAGGTFKGSALLI